jgi:hypothetical protein
VLTAHARVVGKKLRQPVPRLQVVEQRLYRDSHAGKAGDPTQHAGVGGDERVGESVLHV